MDPTANRRETSAATLRLVREDDPALTTLEVSSIGFLKLGFSKSYTHEGTGYFWPEDTDDLGRLGDAIEKNTRLTSLKIPTARNLADMAANNKALFDGIHRNKSIKHLDLSYFDLRGGNELVVEWTSGDRRQFYRNLDRSADMGRGIMEGFVANNLNLTEIILDKCPTLADGGAKILTGAVGRCKSVVEIRLTSCNVDDGALTELVFGIKSLPKLRRLDLSGNRFWRTGCFALFALLRNNDALERLSLCNNDRLDDDCVQTLGHALECNDKLEALLLSGNNTISAYGWNSFCRVLCDTSSVNRTYLSNHTLRDFGVNLPPALSAHLQMNRGGVMKCVATRKILRHHDRLDMAPLHLEWDLKALPHAVGWFNRAKEHVETEDKRWDVDKRKLLTIYQFAKALPAMMVPPSCRPTCKRSIGMID